MKLLVKELSIVTVVALLAMGTNGCGSDRADDLNKTAAQPEYKPDGDNDGDGLLNGQEDKNGNEKWDEGEETDLNNKDTDGDGLWDGNEINVYHTDPLNPDTDGDGVDDGKEVYSCDELLYDIEKYSKHEATNKNSTDSPDVIDALEPNNDSDGDGRTNIGEKEKGTNPCDPDDGYPWILDACKDKAVTGVVYVPGGFDVDGDGEIESGFWVSQYPASAIKSEQLDSVRYEHFEDEMNEKFNVLSGERITEYEDGLVYHSNAMFKAQYVDQGDQASDYLSSIYAMDIPLAFKDYEECVVEGQTPRRVAAPTNKQFIHIYKLQEAYEEANGGDGSAIQNSILGNDVNVPPDYKVDIYYMGLMKEYTKDIVKVEGFEPPEYWKTRGAIEKDDDKYAWTDIDIGDFAFPAYSDPHAVVVRKGWGIDLTFGIGSGDATSGNEVVFRLATPYTQF